MNGSSYVNVGILLTGRTWVTFQVQTSKDATVGLVKYYAQNNSVKLEYEIVIGAGSNTYACIR